MLNPITTYREDITDDNIVGVQSTETPTQFLEEGTLPVSNTPVSFWHCMSVSSDGTSATKINGAGVGHLRLKKPLTRINGVMGAPTFWEFTSVISGHDGVCM